MVIRLIFEEDVPDGVGYFPRTAERDFEWEESMGGIVAVANPNDPTDTLELEVWDNETGEGGKPICSVDENEGKLASFTDILKYGFVETIRSLERWSPYPAPLAVRGAFLFLTQAERGSAKCSNLNLC